MEKKLSIFLKDNWLFVVAIIYVFVRTDLIPDTIPFIGSLDDTALLVIELIRKYVEYKKKEQPQS